MDRHEVARALKGVKLMVATPCYGGQVTSRYLQSMLKLSRMATEIGLEVRLATQDNESLITRARNRSVHQFLESSSTHLFFIDADIGFEAADVFTMLLHDVEVVVGTYAKKGLSWGELVGREIGSELEAQLATMQHVVNRVDPTPVDGSELLEVYDAGTGFMLIRRDVLERMVEAHPEWAYVNEEDGSTWHAVFDCEIDEGRYLSEDYAFCRRWQRMGGRILLDDRVILTHTGSYMFGVKPPGALP